ncbi:MAG: hypothetical protein FJZ76_02590 [Bacteroidetes bacterium]|nr:hypothetical protein [Bacteroidota bacterium]
MGFIPFFLTVGGACLLFFMTVRSTLQRKRNLQHQLLDALTTAYPELIRSGEKRIDLEELLEQWKAIGPNSSSIEKGNELFRELKINKHQYNTLIKKAPYNWVARLGGFQAI